MRVAVTERHIAEGHRHHPYLCPVAVAVHDATGRDLVLVTGEHMIIDGRTGDVSEVVRAWIRRYDFGDQCEPFEFELAWP